MATQQWAQNTLGGYLAVSELAEELRYQAYGQMVLQQFARPLKKGYGARHNDVILYDRMDKVTTGGDEVDEDEEVPATEMLVSQGSLTVKRLMNSIDFTEHVDIFSKWDPEGIYRRGLAEDAAETFDRKLYNKFCEAKVVYTPRGAAGSETETGAWLYTGTATAAAEHPLVKFDLDSILEKALTLKMKPFDADGCFVAIVGPGGARAIRADSAWVNASQYGDPGRLFKSEIGMWDRFRFIEENEHMANVIGTSAFKGQMFVLGKDALAEATALPLTLRAETISGTLGTQFKVGWVSYMGWEIPWNDHASTAAGATGRCRMIQVDGT